MFLQRNTGLRPHTSHLVASFSQAGANMHDCPRSGWTALEPRPRFESERVLIAARDALRRRLEGGSLSREDHRAVLDAVALLRLAKEGKDIRAAKQGPNGT